LILSERHAAALARIADRHGAIRVWPGGRGRLIVGFDSRHAGEVTRLLALDARGVVVASRSLVELDRGTREAA
jgi:hypothetical protein